MQFSQRKTLQLNSVIMSQREQLKAKTIFSLMVMIIILGSTVALLVDANVEVDDLILQFQNGFGSVTNKLGLPDSPGEQIDSVDEAIGRMRKLYSDLEKNLMDMRQRAANDRSSLTFMTMDSLNLI